MFLLVQQLRVELALLPDPLPPALARSRLLAFGSLLVTAALALPSTGGRGRSRFEHRIRSVVERSYEWQGISGVEYDLQVLWPNAS